MRKMKTEQLERDIFLDIWITIKPASTSGVHCYHWEPWTGWVSLERTSTNSFWWYKCKITLNRIRNRKMWTLQRWPSQTVSGCYSYLPVDCSIVCGKFTLQKSHKGLTADLVHLQGSWRKANPDDTTSF